jgi:hypothetical protein
MNRNQLEQTMSLIKRLQRRDDEISMFKAKLLNDKKIVQRHLESPLIGVLDGGKALKIKIGKIKSRIKERLEEKQLAIECIRVLRFLIEEQQAQRLVVQRLKGEITRLKQERLMKDSFAKHQEAFYTKNDLQSGKSSTMYINDSNYIKGPQSHNNIKLEATPEQIKEHNRVLELEQVNGIRKSVSATTVSKMLTPRQLGEERAREKFLNQHNPHIPKLAMSQSSHKQQVPQRVLLPKSNSHSGVDSRVFSMAQAVYDPLRKQYTWIPMGIINEFDAMKLLLQGGQTPNKILAKRNLSNKWQTH